MQDQLSQFGVMGIFAILLIRGLTEMFKAARGWRKSNGATPIHPRKLEIMATQIDHLHELRGVPTELLDETKKQTVVLRRIESEMKQRNGSG